jgi:hypothetical protein
MSFPDMGVVLVVHDKLIRNHVSGKKLYSGSANQTRFIPLDSGSPMFEPLIRLFLFLALAVLVGCASYIAPGAKADLQAIGSASIQEGFAAKATAPFPASIAFVRVQAPSYTNYRIQQVGGAHGSGRFSVITTREVEEEGQIARVTRLPQVAGVTSVNRLLLPQRLDSDKELREAAARLQADLLFVYTFDTAFFETDLAKPLTVISLGLFPSRKIYVTTTVSALLMDTRTGYVYSTYETTKKSETVSTSWGSSDAADEARRQNERHTFEQLVSEFETTWPKLLARHRR